jgi:hypothetical protein
MNAVEALKIIRDRARTMREDGESDLRNIIWLVDGLIRDIEAGKTKEEIMADFADDGTEE